jgi:hypothetical protein
LFLRLSSKCFAVAVAEETRPWAKKGRVFSVCGVGCECVAVDLEDLHFEHVAGLSFGDIDGAGKDMVTPIFYKFFKSSENSAHMGKSFFPNQCRRSSIKENRHLAT